MRYLVVYGIPIIIIAGCIIWAIVTAIKDNAPGSGRALNSTKSLDTGGAAIRALDQILTDPTLIGSSEWKGNAQHIVNEWYKPSRKGLN